MGYKSRSFYAGTKTSIVVAIISILVAGCGDAATAGAGATPVDQATGFWESVESGDRRAAVAAVDPSALSSGDVNAFGRAATLEGQFDWYDAVGWQWTLEGCEEAMRGPVLCTVKASNAWSDALGVDPVEGTFEMWFSEDGISAITDEDEQFIDKWSPLVFGEFANWVATNHPADADVMFDFSADVNGEILDLYRINSERFVAARSG